MSLAFSSTLSTLSTLSSSSSEDDESGGRSKDKSASMGSHVSTCGTGTCFCVTTGSDTFAPGACGTGTCCVTMGSVLETAELETASASPRGRYTIAPAELEPASCGGGTTPSGSAQAPSSSLSRGRGSSKSGSAGGSWGDCFGFLAGGSPDLSLRRPLPEPDGRDTAGEDRSAIDRVELRGRTKTAEGSFPPGWVCVCG